MQHPKILWADDEINLLKPTIMFLQQKGFEVTTVTNGADAVEAVGNNEYDIVFLDEQMPGMNGLDALSAIKDRTPHTPVVMITKSEEEHVMEQAIGAKISSYLIKPVNPNQIISTCKMLLEGQTLVNQKINTNYQQEFRNIGMALLDSPSADEWIDIYRRLIHWELELEQSQDEGMQEVYKMQKNEANVNFSKFIVKNYLKWMKAKRADRPLFSYDLLRERVFPLVKPGEYSLFFILIDCLRYDQWKVFEPILSQYFTIETNDCYYSILPTATQYARNAIFSGMTPYEIAERFPNYWKNDDEEGGKNLFEEEFLKDNIIRAKLNARYTYTKVITNEESKSLAENVLNLLRNDVNFIVINFIDMLTHARSEMNLIKELAPDEAAFRSLAKSWLEHSTFLQMLRKLREHKVKVIITTDHGSVRVHKPIRIIGDRNTTTNLRYKQGRNLSYDQDARQVFAIRKPEDANLPKGSVSGSYAFTTEDAFFVYPNNYNYYVNYFKDTFQHGGISIEEILIPFAVLTPR
jgi:CheY-like chemotaxis protein